MMYGISAKIFIKKKTDKAPYSIDTQECSSYTPAGKKELFINYTLTEMVICYAISCSYGRCFFSGLCLCD
jgi:hypothetical protein